MPSLRRHGSRVYSDGSRRRVCETRRRNNGEVEVEDETFVSCASKRVEWHALTKDQFYLPPTRSSTKWNEPSCLYFPLSSQSASLH